MKLPTHILALLDVALILLIAIFLHHGQLPFMTLAWLFATGLGVILTAIRYAQGHEQAWPFYLLIGFALLASGWVIVR